MSKLPSKSNHPSLTEKTIGFLWRNKRLIPLAVLVVAIVAGAAFWVISLQQNQEQYQVAAQHQVNVGSGYRDISYQGKQYRYNSRITAILYAGVDSDGPLKQSARFTTAPRADSISLIVLDEFHHKMTVIALSRDTMTKIRRYTLNGRNRGMFTDHLGYAYTYGNGGAISCQNLCEAVSELLYGVPVNEYIVTNRSSLSLLGEIIGPVELTVPNDDLAKLDAAYSAGRQVTIDGSNLETFVRSRDTTEDLSNVGRMQRQQAYINGAVERIRKLLKNSPNDAWSKVESAEEFMQTNITRSRYLDLIRVLNNTAYDEKNYYMPEGSQVVGADHDEFYPDQEALLSKVIEIFYLEK